MGVATISKAVDVDIDVELDDIETDDMVDELLKRGVNIPDEMDDDEVEREAEGRGLTPFSRITERELTAFLADILSGNAQSAMKRSGEFEMISPGWSNAAIAARRIVRRAA